ncbi:MAG: autotransporter-associated beta strand repeat-containing protein [Verrucomicrobiota bacterium]
MKTKLTILKLTIILCSIFATTAVFGQNTWFWTGAGDGTNLDVAANWTPSGGPPVPNNLDICEWNGLTTSNLVLTIGTSGALGGSSGSTRGLTPYLTVLQTNSVQIGTRGGANSGTIRLNGVTLDPGAAPFILGDTNLQYFVDVVWGGVAGQNHDLLNNSTNPATIYPNVQNRYGGGGNHNMIIDGSGDWNIHHYLITQNGSGTTVNKLGTGTMRWYGTNIPPIVLNSIINSPVTFNAGTIILETYDLLNSQAIQNNTTVTNVLIYNDTANAGLCNLSGAIAGPLALTVSAGRLELSGANTFSGGNVTLSGGELTVNQQENPTVSGPLGLGGAISGPITFAGGTLGYSSVNTYDYSSRFDTAAGQAYSIDVPGGQAVAFATGLTSSGGSLAKAGSGTLTITGVSSYSGATTVSGGALVFAKGAKTGTGPVTVAGGGTLGVTDPAGSQVTASTLTLSDGSALSFYNVTNPITPPLGVTSLVSAGTTTINVVSGVFANNTSYPLFAWDSGSAPGVSLGILNGALGNLSINGNEIQLNITALADNWNGNVDGNWTTALNWISGGGPATYVDPTPVVFGDSALGTTTVTVNALVQPKSVTFNNSSLTYSVASSGGNNIGGVGTLAKLGGGTATLSGGANTYTGVTTVSGGILSVSTLTNGGSVSDIGEANNTAANLVLNGGTLQYTGPAASVDRLFTLNPAGGAIDASGSGALYLDNVGSILVSGGGLHALVLTGALADTNTLAAVLSDGTGGGSASLTKNGAGTWIVTGTNTYSGGTIINSGTLQVGASPSGSLGSGNVDDESVLVFKRSGTLLVPGVISGNGSVGVTGGGTIILANNNTYKGGTTISNANDTLQIGNGGASGSLYSAGGVVDNGTFAFNGTGISTLEGGNALISGPGNVIVSGNGGLFQAEGPNSYTGWTLINSGATFQPCTGNEGSLISSVVTNNGTLKFVRQDWGIYGYTNNIVGTGRVWKDVNNFNAGDVTLLGTNTYTGNTFIAGGGLVLGDGATPGLGSIVGSVMFTNSVVSDVAKYLEFNRPDNLTFTNPITGLGSAANMGFVLQNCTNVLTLTGNNTYSGGTVISNGIVQVGNGGPSGSIGSGAVVLASQTTNCEIVFDVSANVAVSIITAPGTNATLGVSSLFGTVTNAGTGSLVQFGSGTLTIGPTNNYIGSTTVSNGTLVVTGGSLGGDMDVSGGILVAGGVGSVSTLTVGGNMNISAGTVVATLNKSLSPTSTLFSVAGAINATGGSLKLVNYGPALVANDTFTIFSEPVIGGGAITIVPVGFTVENDLASSGSVKVLSALPQPTITAALSAGQLTLSWPAGWIGLHLQSQTNALTKGLSTNWVNIPGTDTSDSYLITPDKTQPTVFYRLAP